MRTDFRPTAPATQPRLTISGIRSYIADPASASWEMSSLLRRSGYGALRLLVKEKDIQLLADYLEAGPASPELCRRFLMEENPTDLSVRILLLQAAGGNIRSSKERMAPRTPDSSDPISSYRTTRLSLAQQAPFLRIPLALMELRPSRRVADHGTDGTAFYLHPDRTAPLTPEEIRHMCIHCMFGHRKLPAGADPMVWNVASDLACEYLRARIFPDADSLRTYESLAPVISTFPRSLYPGSAAAVYRQLTEDLPPEEIRELGLRLRHDDHTIWYADAEDEIPEGGGGSDGESGILSPEESERIWKEALAQVPRKTGASRRGIAPGSREEQILLLEEAKHDFRRYLRRFAVIREELQLDMESFDYIPYDYGLRTYGNMPLIEPLETTEAFKVEQLAIAIDTSGSCDTLLVQNFLTEVHRILTTHENFFRRMEVHLFQCDSVIHEHRIIHSTEEWMDYIEHITIRGRGGTDFTPVFESIQKMQTEGQCQRLRGLLYFTDGDGIYPREAPPYETAFIFSRRDYMQYHPPAWCVKLCADDTDERF